MRSKLEILADRWEFSNSPPNKAYIDGFKDAFEAIDENLSKELIDLEKYPWMGERIMTLKIYKSKIKQILVDMEKKYE